MSLPEGSRRLWTRLSHREVQVGRSPGTEPPVSDLCSAPEVGWMEALLWLSSGASPRLVGPGTLGLW